MFFLILAIYKIELKRRVEGFGGRGRGQDQNIEMLDKYDQSS